VCGQLCRPLFGLHVRPIHGATFPVDLSTDIEIAQEVSPESKQRPVSRPTVQAPPRRRVVSILLGQIVPAATGNQDIEDGVEAASVIGPRPPHHSLTAHLVGNLLPLFIGDGYFHADNF